MLRGRGSPALWAVVGGGLVLVGALSHVPFMAARPVWLAIVVIGGVLGWRTTMRRNDAAPGALAVPVLAGFAAVGAAANNAIYGFGLGHGSPVVLIAVSSVLAALAWGAAAAGDGVRIGLIRPALVFLVLHTALVVTWLGALAARIDVEVVLREGASSLLSGHNPYAMTFPNIYTPEETEAIYGPGFMVDGRIPYGFPYPPLILLSAIPGHLLGDVRISGLLAQLAIALAIYGRGRSALRRAAAVAALSAPGAAYVLFGAWTEPVSVLLLAAFVAAVRCRQLVVAAALLGAFLVSKQYLITVLPCLWLLRPYATRARLGITLATGAALTVPWLVADPGAFVRALAGFQLAGHLRHDSLSVAVAVADAAGFGDGWAFRALPLGVGPVVAVLAAWRGRPGVESFSVACGLTLLATVLVSKQAFFNYFDFIGWAFLIGGYALGSADGGATSAAPADDGRRVSGPRRRR